MIDSKICSRCKIEKPFIEFSKHKGKKDGLQNLCKACYIFYAKNYRHQNKQEIKKYNKKYYDEHKEEIKEYSKNNKDNLQKYQKQYCQENKETINKQKRLYNRKLRETDINFKILGNLRTRVYHALKDNIKSAHTLELIGCSVDELKQHLSKKFAEGMTWGNHGVQGWHIDHIIPCDYFDLSDIEQQKKCFHYTNLQPLWAIDNLKKHTKIC